MISLSELKEMPESKRLLRLTVTAVLLWGLGFVILFCVWIADGNMERALRDKGTIIDRAVRYRAFPASDGAKTVEGDAISLVSDIVETLNMRDRVQQLQSNASGVLLQLERIYGAEMKELLSTMESRGLKIKTAEIKALPVGENHLLGATFQLEQNR